MMCFADLSQIPQIAICAFFVVLSAAFLLFFLLGLLNRKERAWIHLLFALPSYGIFQLLYDYHGSVSQEIFRFLRSVQRRSCCSCYLPGHCPALQDNGMSP